MSHGRTKGGPGIHPRLVPVLASTLNPTGHRETVSTGLLCFSPHAHSMIVPHFPPPQLRRRGARAALCREARRAVSPAPQARRSLWTSRRRPSCPPPRTAALTSSSTSSPALHDAEGGRGSQALCVLLRGAQNSICDYEYTICALFILIPSIV